MKNLFFLAGIVLLFSCSQPLDENKAKAKASELLELLKAHDYDKTSALYSNEFNESENAEARKIKFEKIESATGPIVKYELATIEKTKIDERDVFTLKYKVTCANTVVTETFIIAPDEGEYKVLNHQVTNM
jgi:hypothetical protein